MSISARVRTAVDKAFKSAGDLVVSAELRSKAVSSFDFQLGETKSISSTETVEVIVTSTEKPSGEGFTKTAIMKSGLDLSVYDSITIDGKRHNIVDYDDNGFTITVIIVKER
jgi:hypothetical protein